MKIRIDHIAKIEGHASFTANIVAGDVQAAKIKIEEGARLFEGIMRDRKDEELPELASRICGVCSVVHNLTGFKVLENAYGIIVKEPTLSLRKLMMLGQLINSHALHLFFFSLSDFLGFKNDLELINEYPDKTHDAIKIRDVGNKIVEVIGGRAIHPLTNSIGGIRKTPKEKELESLLNDCINVLPLATKLAKTFRQLNYPEFQRKTTYVSLNAPEEYAIYDGNLAVDGKLVDSIEFLKNLEEFQEKDKVAKRTRINNASYMVGALARLNFNSNKLNPESKKLLEESKIKLPSYNPFHNIFAQAIEIVHCLEEAIKIFKKITEIKIEAQETKIENQSGRGVGMIEAPRGTLFYDATIKNRFIETINIITPTAQNIANLETDLEEFEKVFGFKNLSKKEREDKIKMLIRAYDPCVTCAVH